MLVLIYIKGVIKMKNVLTGHKKIRYRKRLLLNIPDEIHMTIVHMADHKGITITKYVLQAVAEQILKDKMYE